MWSDQKRLKSVMVGEIMKVSVMERGSFIWLRKGLCIGTRKKTVP